MKIRLALFMAFCFLICSSHLMAATGPVTLFAPGLPAPEKSQKNQKGALASLTDGTDILISLVSPYEYMGHEMDRPQFLGMYHYQPFDQNQKQSPEIQDLLSDLEEIRYLDQKAWTVNIASDQPGLYQLVLETRPWWDERRNIFIQQQGKLLLPVLGIDDGWNLATGQSLEILPLSNPFGLVSPAFFAGQLLIDGKPAPDMQILMGQLNTGREKVENRWQEAQEARSDANGQFGFILNKPGWWYCEARIPGAPLKGADGKQHDLLRSTLLWVHVNAARENKKAKK